MTNKRYIRMMKHLLVLILTLPASGAVGKKVTSTGAEILWEVPGNIRDRNLFYGPGGQNHEPHEPFTFIKEDLDGTNPKFVVRDRDGIKWKVKLGQEARPETVASRLVWAVGYFADEDYFLTNMKVERMGRLRRGRNLVEPDGSVHNVRLKRENYKTEGEWTWREDPFTGTREWNGLRVMMALINNWDLKDENNKIRDVAGKRVYLVSDLGASFGASGFSITQARSKGNWKVYSRSRLVKNCDLEYVTFSVPARPALIHLFEMPEFIRRVRMEWIGRNVPVSDARWIGGILSSLSSRQIEDAFRAAGYSFDEVEQFSQVVERRITQLSSL